MRPHEFVPQDVRVDIETGNASASVSATAAGRRLIHDLLAGQAGSHKLLLVPDTPEVRAALQAIGEWPAGLTGPPCEICGDRGMRATEALGEIRDSPCQCEAGEQLAARLHAARGARMRRRA